jgi:hypothetical protein
VMLTRRKLAHRVKTNLGPEKPHGSEEGSS